jgi:hypothetical protein
MTMIVVPLTCVTCRTKLKLEMQLGDLNETVQTVDERANEHHWTPGPKGWVCNRHGETK